MNKRASLTILLSLFVAVACTVTSPGNGSMNLEAAPATVALPARASIDQVDPVASADQPVTVSTDRDRYWPGETIILTIDNRAGTAIQFMANCSPNLCLSLADDWICEERECDGNVTILETGNRLELLPEARVMSPSASPASASRYKLDYQLADDPAYQFAHSNAFKVDPTGPNCEGVKATAVERALDDPYWSNVDPSRVIIRWLEEIRRCQVDFAARSAEQIRAGLWSEGYTVLIDPASGRITEATAYER